MSEQLKASLVRIFLKGDETTPIGVGFLVPDKYVLTCAHVVTQALGLREIYTIPNDNISLDFPLVAPKKILQARVIGWQPKDEEDIAILELESLPPNTTQPIRLITSHDLWGHSFRAFGFPRDYDEGVWASGIMRDRNAEGWLQIEAVNVPGHSVVQGFSGTPVWDEQLDGIAGMVVESDAQVGIKAAYIIPTALLIKAWPSLAQQTILPCPYRGLFAFREIDASYYFGREVYIEQLVEAVRKQALVTVVGPSGSGKSSVVFAGLVPRLREEGSWLITSFRPGNQPFRALATALIPFLEAQMSETDRLVEIKKLTEHFQKCELALRDVVERIVQKHFGARLLLIADQFEELYTLCSSTEERERFLDFLLEAGQSEFHQRIINFHTVITLRADFFGHALTYRPFADALQGTDVKLGPMTRQELQDAIKKPAEKLNIQVDGGLIERILGSVKREPGCLPLLEFTLTLLWKKQRERKLTLTAYDEIGGVERSLAAYAEEVYNELSEEERKQSRQMFIQLVRPGEGTEDTRRLATRAEVGEENWNLVIYLSNTRLVVSGCDEATGIETVEIVHEALIKGWKRLCEWLDDDREFRIWQERIRATVRQWKATHYNDVLLRGALLAEAEGWTGRYSNAISLDEKAFVQASQRLQHLEDQRWKELYKKAEQQRHRLELIIRSIAEGLLITDAYGNITLFNQFAHSIFAQSDVNLQPELSLYEQAEKCDINWLSRLVEIIAQALLGKIITNQELIVGKSEDNVPFTLSVSAAPFYEEEETHIHLVGTVTILNDVTSNKQIERLKDDFVSLVSHELRTPITAIKGYTQHIERRLERRLHKARTTLEGPMLLHDLPENYDLRSLSIILSQAGHLERLVNDLLDLSQVQWGRLNLRYETFYLADMLVESVRLTQARTELHTIYLDIQTQETSIIADRIRVEQVVGNILDNAIKYSPHGGKVTVRLEILEDEYLVSVIDEGIGISPEQFDHIFERFYRVHNTNIQQYSGIGLGLFVAKAIVDEHKGRIWFSNNQSIGSTFHFTLPLTEKDHIRE